MKLISITLQSFKSFSTRQRFEFPLNPGFFFITGENKLEPDLAANAAGKSSLLDAITFAFFGRTTRGLKAGDIKSWNSELKCAVEIEFSISDSRYTVVRTWSPNSLSYKKGDGSFATAEQSDIDKLIGLSFEDFLYSILFSQFRSTFLDLSPSEKTSLFSSVLQLDIWDQFSENAKVEVSKLEAFYLDTRSFIDTLKGEINSLRGRSFEEQINKWEEERNLKVAEIDKQSEDLREKILGLKHEGEELLKNKEKSKKKLEELKSFQPEIAALNKSARLEMKKAQLKDSELGAEVNQIEKEYLKISAIQDTCPYCDQPMSPQHKRRELKKLESKGKEIRGSRLEVGRQLKMLEKELNEVLEEEQSLIKDVATTNIEFSSFVSQFDAVKRVTQEIVIRGRELSERKRKLLDQRNPFLDEQTKTNSRIKAAELELESQGKDIVKIQSDIDLAKYWVKGFKEIRLFLISETLSQLEVEVNNVLYRLGLKDWRVEFAVDKETKKGTVRKGFAVLVYSPYNSEAVAFECWSGGETQRLKLAGSIGLANLILARNAVDSKVLFLDEPTQWLSESGVEDLLTTLAEIARTEQKQIFIIDHRALSNAAFDQIFAVVKDVNGSRVELVN